VSTLLALLLAIFHRLPAGAQLYLRSYKSQETELRELDWLVEPGTIAVDVGANLGAYTYALAEHVGANGSVVSIEPIDELAHYLAVAARQLRLPVTVHRACVSSFDGEGSIFVPLSASGVLLTGFARLGAAAVGPGQFRRTTVRQLDQLLDGRQTRVSFIKCDVEGHELEVFRGATKVLSSDRPNLVVEIEQQHLPRPIDECFAFFDMLGYSAWFIDEAGALRSRREFTVDRYQPDGASCMNGRRYVNNFIFLPKEAADAFLARRVDRIAPRTRRGAGVRRLLPRHRHTAPEISIECAAL
jgi:FkbM family methyltransferase